METMALEECPERLTTLTFLIQQADPDKGTIPLAPWWFYEIRVGSIGIATRLGTANNSQSSVQWYSTVQYRTSVSSRLHSKQAP